MSARDQLEPGDRISTEAFELEAKQDASLVASASKVGSPVTGLHGTHEGTTGPGDSLQPSDVLPGCVADNDEVPESTALEAKLDRALDARARDAQEGAIAVVGPARPAAYLVVVRGDPAGKTIPLMLGSPWTLGRSDSAAVPLQSKAVSLEHARIEPYGDRFRLVDLDSTNGTLLNGRAVLQPVFLRAGDTIEIADTALVFLTDDSDEIHATVPIRATGMVSQANSRLAPVIWRGPGGAFQHSDDFTAPALWASARRSPEVEEGGGEERGLSLVDLLQKAMTVLALLRRHWRKLLALPALCGALGLATLLVMPPPSEVEFELGIHWKETENPLVSQRMGPNRDELERFYSGATMSFTDARLVRATFQRLGDANPKDAVTRATSSQLQLSPVREEVFRGSMKTRDAGKTIEFLNRHIEGYIREEVQKTLRVAQAHIDFLSRQVEEKNQALLRTERELREFRSKHLMQLPELAGGRLAGASDLENRQGTVSAEVTRLEGELRLAQEQLARESPLLEAKVAAAAPYRQARDDANRRLAQARARGLGSEHPDVRQLEREIAELQKKAEEAERSDVSRLEREANPAYAQLKDRVGALRVQLAAARQELGSIGGQLGTITKTAAAMPEVEAAQARLTRTHQMDQELHARLVERLRQAQVQSELDRASAEARYEIVTAPHSLGVQLRKSLLMRSGIGVAVGLLLACVWGVLVELRRFIRSNTELQAFIAQAATDKRPAA